MPQPTREHAARRLLMERQDPSLHRLRRTRRHDHADMAAAEAQWDNASMSDLVRAIARRLVQDDRASSAILPEDKAISQVLQATLEGFSSAMLRYSIERLVTARFESLTRGYFDRWSAARAAEQVREHRDTAADLASAAQAAGHAAEEIFGRGALAEVETFESTARDAPFASPSAYVKVHARSDATVESLVGDERRFFERVGQLLDEDVSANVQIVLTFI